MGCPANGSSPPGVKRLANRQSVASPAPIVFVAVTSGDKDGVLAATSDGHALGVPASELALLSGVGKGSMLMKVDEDARVLGAIIGGLIIGVGEKLSEVYVGPYVGGGIEIWFAYVLALVFLLFRPQGLFGEKIIDRV